MAALFKLLLTANNHKCTKSWGTMSTVFRSVKLVSSSLKYCISDRLWKLEIFSATFDRKRHKQDDHKNMNEELLQFRGKPTALVLFFFCFWANHAHVTTVRTRLNVGMKRPDWRTTEKRKRFLLCNILLSLQFSFQLLVYFCIFHFLCFNQTLGSHHFYSTIPVFHFNARLGRKTKINP